MEDYQVFINHRGPDVKKTLASLFYHPLKMLGLRVFLDKNELQAGDYLSPAILYAIHSASVHIAIFSKRYAESAWCLNELLEILQMVESHHAKVIPVFCGVQPSDLRHIDKGIYADAFHKHRHDGRVETQLVERWRESLNKVSGISGKTINMDEDDLGEFVHQIVEIVLKEVRMDSLDVAEHPVGLDQAAEDFQREILSRTDLSVSSMVVGIVGLGGSGKSTLVKHLYNSKRSEFTRSCFLSDISKTHDLPGLQKELLNHLLGYHKLHIENTSKGRKLLRERPRGFRVLIVFDDINNTEQIENLLLVKDVVGNGSLIFVTSRDRDLLARSDIKILYNVKPLDVKDAQELFCRHAFHEPKPLPGFQHLVQQLVEMCGGFPLALKVLAGQLYGNHDSSYWTRQKENLQTQMPDEIFHQVILNSYGSLKNKEREVFLDLAHFLVGEDKDLAARVLEGLVDCNGLDCLHTLHQKCLVEFETADVDFNIKIQPQITIQNMEPFFFKPSYLFEPFSVELLRSPKGSFRIRMHDLVRDLARQIGRQQSPLRLCCSNDKMISTNLQSKPYTVRGIRRDEDEEKLQLPFFLQNQDICGLKLLVLPHSTSDLQFNGLSGDLVWLRMRKLNCSDILSSRLSLRDLRVLELTDVNLEDLCRLADDSEPPQQLSELTLTVTSTEICQTPIHRRSGTINTPNSGFDKSSRKSFSQVGKALQIDSSMARNILGELSRPINILQDWFAKLNLKKVEKLVLNNIKGMSSVPIKFDESRNLRHLDLSGCSGLEELPHSFTELVQLQYLALRDCRNLLLPDLGKISTLEYLDFGGCNLLKQLPKGIIAQRSLKYLNLLPTSIEQLPEHLEQLENLEELYIGSLLLRSFPSSLNNLSQLTVLILYECPNVCDISKSVEQLMHLERLSIHKSRMSTLPEGTVWRSVKVMDVQHCPINNQFNIGGDAGQMPLDGFQIQENFNQGELAMRAAHDNCTSSLTNLIIRYSRITKVYISPARSHFPHLEIIDLSNNPILTEIEGLPGNLTILGLKYCPALKTLTCLSDLASLNYLNISGCDGLERLNVEGLSSLEVIEAEMCWKLRTIEGLDQLQKLSHIQMSTGSSWRDILGFPSNLSTAIISGAAVNSEDVEEMDIITHSLGHVSVRDIPPLSLETGNPVDVELEYASIKGAILLCLIADKYAQFKVTLIGNGYSTSCFMNDGNMYRAHMFMWKQDSEVFKDLKHCGDEPICCKIQLLNPRKTNVLTDAGLKRGWMVSAENLEISKQSQAW